MRLWQVRGGYVKGEGRREKGESSAFCLLPSALTREAQISPRFANWAMCSPALNASAEMVAVGWPRDDVTMLLPSQMKRFRTSCVRWYLSTTEVRGSAPIRQVPSRCTDWVCGAIGTAQALRAPAAF